MRTFSYKIHRGCDDTLLAVSDLSLIGKTLEEKDISFYVSKDFYHEDTCDEKNIIKLIKKATIINAIGKDVIDVMIKEKIIENNSIIRIGDVPHAQVVSV